MVEIKRGNGSSLKADTLEERMLEGFHFMKSNLGSTQDALIDFDIDFDNKRILVNYEFPARHHVNDEGKTEITGTDFLGEIGFVPGSDGDFKSQSICSQMVEMLMHGQNLEILQKTGTSNENRIIANFNSDNQKLTGSVLFDIYTETSTNDGKIHLIAKEFLS